MRRAEPPVVEKESYSPEDLQTALRTGSALWAMGMAIAILLIPLSPPTRRSAGADGSSPRRSSRRGRRLVRLPLPEPALDLNRLYASSFLTIIAIGLMQWLAGGVGAPY